MKRNPRGDRHRDRLVNVPSILYSYAFLGTIQAIAGFCSYFLIFYTGAGINVCCLIVDGTGAGLYLGSSCAVVGGVHYARPPESQMTTKDAGRYHYGTNDGAILTTHFPCRRVDLDSRSCG